MATNIVSKYDHITPKELIRPGSPDIYRLIPKKERIGTLTKITFGTKDANKSNKTILLVGETGTGKSTLINTLVNYAIGVKWEDNVWFEIVEEKKKKGQSESEDEEQDQCESKTLDVNLYEIFGFEDKTLPFSLTIIDTPGYGDTKGINYDGNVGKKLLNLFCTEGGVDEIHAVGLVLKASENRLNDRQRYIFDSVLSLFGKDMEDSIVALITHSTGTKPKNALKALEAAKVKYAKNENNQPVYFLFDNCQCDNRTEEPEDLEYAFKKTTKGTSQFTDFLEKSVPKRLLTTVDVLYNRENLKARIKNLREKVEFLENQQRALKENQKALKESEKQIEKNKDFTITSYVSYRAKEYYDGGRKWTSLWLAKTGTLCCTKCEENCHDLCCVSWTVGMCGMIEDGKCTVCTNKCDESHHVKESWRYVDRIRPETKTCHQMKEEYEQSLKNYDQSKSLLENLQITVETLQKDKNEVLEETFQLIVNLEQIALNADSLSIHTHLDFLIEKMEEKGDKEKVQKLREMELRADKGTQAGIGYMEGGAKKKRRTEVGEQHC